MFTDRYRTKTIVQGPYQSTTKEIWDVNHRATRPFYSDARYREVIRDEPPLLTAAVENGYTSKGWWGAESSVYRVIQDPIGEARRSEAARAALYKEICTGKEASGLLESAAEIGQTVKMLTNPMGVINLLRKLGSGGEKTLKGAYLSWERRTHAKNRRRLLPAQLLELASNIWLEKKYGWDPFLADIETLCVMGTHAADTVQTVREKCKQPYVVSSGQIQNTTELEVVTYVAPSVLVYGDYRTYCTKKASCTYSTTLKARVQATCPAAYLSTEGALRTLGLGISVAYNLVPYSFVFDWFFEVGGRLERMGWRPAATFLTDPTAGAGKAFALQLSRTENVEESLYTPRVSANGNYKAVPISGSRQSLITREWSRSTTTLQPSWTDQPLPSGWSGANTISGLALIAQRALRDL